MMPIKSYIIMSYFLRSFTRIFFFLIFTISSFSQTADNKRESRVNRKERKIDEIYKMETSNINLLPFAQEFHQRYEKYLKESIKRQLKSRWADAMYAFGSGLQGTTANPETFEATRIENERRRIYEDWINNLNTRRQQDHQSNTSNSDSEWIIIGEKNDSEFVVKLKSDNISRDENGNHIVWLRWEYSGEERLKCIESRYLEELKHGIDNPDKWIKFSHVIENVIFDEKNRSEKIISKIWYDRNNDMIDFALSQDSDWYNIESETVMEVLFENTMNIIHSKE